jgi:DHA1 family inner membrane transport protein
MIHGLTGRSWLLPVLPLSLGAFAVGTTELIVTGLLPTLAGDLGVDIPTAGLLISAYAAFVAVGGPLLAIATGRVPRKPLLLVLMAVFVLGNILCALATNYWLLLGARLVIACSHGLFFGVALVVVTGLVPANRQSSAVSFVVAGFTLANLLGAPIGTAIGNAYGWRAAFAAIAAIGVVVAIAIAALVPAVREDHAEGSTLRAELRAVGRQTVLMSYLMIALNMTAALALFAYIVPLLTSVTGFAIGSIPWILFAAGVGGVFGNLIGGRLGDWKPMPALIAIFGLQLVIYLVALAAVREPVAMAVLVFLWFGTGLAFAAPAQARILKGASDAPNFASTLISTAFNIGIAAGPWLGGLALYSGWGFARLPWISVVFVAAALAVALLSAGLERRAADRPAMGPDGSPEPSPSSVTRQG